MYQAPWHFLYDIKEAFFMSESNSIQVTGRIEILVSGLKIDYHKGNITTVATNFYIRAPKHESMELLAPYL